MEQPKGFYTTGDKGYYFEFSIGKINIVIDTVSNMFLECGAQTQETYIDDVLREFAVSWKEIDWQHSPMFAD